MTLFHPHFGIPELKALDSRQRRIVWRAIIYPASLWFAPLNIAWLLLGIFIVAPVGQRLTGHLWGAMLFGCFTVVILGCLQDRALAWLFRGRVLKFIREHAADFQPGGMTK